MKKNIKFNHISIICNGEDYLEEKIFKYFNDSDYVIAVDGGLGLLDKLLLKPDFIIGDMDSIDERILLKYKSIPREVYSAEKDLTDSELAVQKAINFGPQKISILASTGSYIDHSLANIINLLRNYNKKIDMKIITKNAEIFPVFNKKSIKNASGKRVSIFPIGNIEEIVLKGFKYTFKDKTNLLPIDYSVSNIILKNIASVDVKKGMLICILFDKEYS